VAESAGNPQDLLSDPSTTFAEDDGLIDESADEIEEIDVVEKPPTRRGREGLPPDFRMRHDAHYVDDLVAAPTIRQVAITEIDRDLGDDRSAQSLDILADSIRRAGILQPLLVATRGGRFQLIDGHRRIEAAVLAGLRHVPCIVHDLDDGSAEQMRRAVNIPQPALNPELAASIPPLAVASLAQRLELAQAQLSAGASASRPAADLLRAELAQATRVARAAAIMLDIPRLRRRELSARALADRVVSATANQRRIAGIDLAVSIDDADFQVPADPALATQALAATIDALIALFEDSGVPDRDAPSASLGGGAITLTTHCVKTRPAMIIDIAQRLVSVEPELMGQFFDANSTVHPGGASVALLLSAAARIVRAHGGRADVRRDDPVGCTVTFVLPQSAGRI
jgi:ParB family chromosome partitioning protein